MSCKSLKAQGIDREPEPHLGPKATKSPEAMRIIEHRAELKKLRDINREMRRLTKELAAEKPIPQDIVAEPEQVKTAAAPASKPETEKIQEVVNTPDTTRSEDLLPPQGEEVTTISSIPEVDKFESVKPSLEPVVPVVPAQSEALPHLPVKESNHPIQQPASDSVVKAVAEPPAPAFTADDLRKIASLSYNIHKTTEEHQDRITAEISEIWEAAGKPGNINIDYEGKPLTINDVPIKELVANLPQVAPKPTQTKDIKR